ncbi:hypothetical protein IFR05_001658 [Cadophora sp. M221]|nr:hypothetical protein IFR05_001658 [Cadophora sp. M221]
MEFSPTNRRQRRRIPTLREWVVKRIDARDFNHNPVVGPDVLQPWSLDVDLLSYQVMLETRSRRQATEFIELWKNIRDHPRDSGMLYDDRQWHDRRELYGLGRNPSPEMARVEAAWRDAREKERRVTLANLDIPVEGDSLDDFAKLAEIHQGILHLCWICLMLDMPFTPEQEHRVEDFIRERREIHSRIDFGMTLRRRSFFPTQAEADRAREIHRGQILQRAEAEWAQREQDPNRQVQQRVEEASEYESETASESSQAPSESPSDARSYSTSSLI